MTMSLPIIEAEGLEHPVLIVDDQPVISESGGDGALTLHVLTIEMMPLPLNADDHPVLAAIWGSDDDDDIFADAPAV